MRSSYFVPAFHNIKLIDYITIIDKEDELINYLNSFFYNLLAQRFIRINMEQNANTEKLSDHLHHLSAGNARSESRIKSSPRMSTAFMNTENPRSHLDQSMSQTPLMLVASRKIKKGSQ
jgi:tRNA U34 5-carboxymethylaminomethyl modifying GTPase MnmE/TrmE